MDAYPDVDDRELGPEHSICRECGACDCEDCDGHAPNCSYSSDYYEPRDEHDTPIDEEEVA